ncbi:DUF1653 domain-containing protein [Roseobacter sp. A03A-229]
MSLIARLLRMMRRVGGRHNAGASQHPEPLANAPVAADALRPVGAWSPTHRHRKGGLYRVLAHGILEADRSDAVIYDDAGGTIWVRPVVEFEDGRFERLAPAGQDA